MSSFVLSDGLRSLDFLAGGNIYVTADGLNIPVPAHDETWVEASGMEGRSRIRSRAQNAEQTFSVYIRGASETEFWDAVDDLQELVASAHRRKGTIAYGPPRGAPVVTWRLEAIRVSGLPQRGVTLRQLHAECEVTYETKPYGELEKRPVPLEPARSYGEMVLDLDPLMLLSLGATDGLTDLSGNGNHGTAVGGVTVGGFSPGPLPLGDDGATDFDDTDDGVVVSSLTYNPAQDYTWMGWARRSSIGSYDVLVASPNSQSPALLFTDSGDVEFRRHGTSDAGAAVWTGAAPAAGDWFHWALSIDQSAAKVGLFIDGGSVGERDRGADPASPGAIQFGLRQTSGIPFHGQMGWVSVHGEVLS